MSICWGATDFGGGACAIIQLFRHDLDIRPGYDSANQTVYLDDMLRWGLGWLIKVSHDVCPLIHAHTPLHRRIPARTRCTCKSQTVLVPISHLPLHWLNSFVYS
jgi:hypothetical protein